MLNTAQLESRLRAHYLKAEKDMRSKWDAYTKETAELIKSREATVNKAQKAYDSAAAGKDKVAAEAELKKQKKAYDAFLSERMKTSRQMKDIIDGLTEDYAQANQTALNIINGELPTFYASGVNDAANSFNEYAEEANLNIRFNLTDPTTVTELIQRGDEDILPSSRKLDIPKDKQWNKKAINTQILQGILQGENVPTIAERLRNVTDMNEKQAIRNARTLITAAYNKGSLDEDKIALKNGIVVKKRWLSTDDGRTRDSHSSINGEVRDVDKPFSNGLMYPGDPSGMPEEVYNCRCTMLEEIVGFVGQTDGNISYVNYGGK